MKAVQMVAWQSGPEIRDVPVPAPGPGEVLVKVASAGVCHSDLHIMEWPAGLLPYPIPFTLGHEGAGHVAAVGAGVSSVQSGDAVAVYGPWGCGACSRCVAGEENYCLRAAETGKAGPGLGWDGAMAEYLLVPHERWLVPLGSLDLSTAAPLTDAALTPYHAIKRSLPLLVPGTTAVVIGIGGLGHMAVQILKALSPARVIAVDVAADKLELARAVGADETVVSDAGAAERVRELSGGYGAELVVDCVGSQPTVELAAQVATSRSDLTIVGLAGGALPVRFGAIPFECSVSIPYWGSRTELVEVLALAASGQIRTHVETFPLEQAVEVYQRLRDGALTGRAVLVP